jgi:hypothetical protein
MSSQKYYYNSHTLQFEEYRIPLKKRFYRTLGLSSAILVTAFGIYILAYTSFPSQKEKSLLREIDQMKYEYGVVATHLEQLAGRLNQIQERDAEVHRFMLGMEPIDSTVWEAGVGGHERYASLMQFPHSGEIMTLTRRRVDQLSRQMELQAGSLDSIETMALAKEEKLASIPSIKPVRVDLLRRNVTLLSGFGMRVHPIHKVRKMHTGIDFTAPTGTAIQATGNGVVVAIKESGSGYGRHIVIDHGFDYQTLYGHMAEIHVKLGEQVKKGQQIGTVGSTGTCTAPHCHYEVHYNGVPVDPIHYCLDGLTPQEYKSIVDQASIANQSFD